MRNYLCFALRAKPTKADRFLARGRHYGRAKETVEMDNAGTQYAELPPTMLEKMLQMRREIIAKRKETPALPPQDRDGRRNHRSAISTG